MTKHNNQWMSPQISMDSYYISVSKNGPVEKQSWHKYHWPQARDWREAACRGYCLEVWYLDSWRHRTAGFSWKLQSCQPHFPPRSGWSGCCTQTASCGKRCLPVHNWKRSSDLCQIATHSEVMLSYDDKFNWMLQLDSPPFRHQGAVFHCKWILSQYGCAKRPYCHFRQH